MSLLTEIKEVMAKHPLTEGWTVEICLIPKDQTEIAQIRELGYPVRRVGSNQRSRVDFWYRGAGQMAGADCYLLGQDDVHLLPLKDIR